jgi:hypothetical protein
MQYEIVTDDSQCVYVRCWSDPTDEVYQIIPHAEFKDWSKGKLKVETKTEKEGR